MSKRPATKSVPASQMVVDGEFTPGPDYVSPEGVQRVQARVVRSAVPPRPQGPPPTQLNVRLGNVAQLSLPVSPIAGLAIAAGAVVAYKVVLPRLVEYLNGGPPRRRTRIKLPPGGPAK